MFRRPYLEIFPRLDYKSGLLPRHKNITVSLWTSYYMNFLFVSDLIFD